MDGRIRAALAAALLAAQPGCVTPPPPYQLGAGASYATLHTDYPALGDQSAPGVALVGSWSFTEGWWLDLSASAGHRIDTGATQDIYYPPDRAEFGVFSVDLRRELWPLEQRGWTPWLLGGLAAVEVVWDSYWYDVAGSGYVLGAGADVQLGDLPLALRGQVLHHMMSGEDNYGHGPYRMTSTMGGLLLVWTFGDAQPADH